MVGAAGLLSALMVVALLTAALLGPDGIVRHRQLESDLERVRALNEQLRGENRRLTAERDALRHDPTYIDAVIRDDLGYTRPDELVIQLPSAPPHPADVSARQPTP